MTDSEGTPAPAAQPVDPRELVPTSPAAALAAPAPWRFVVDNGAGAFIFLDPASIERRGQLVEALFLVNNFRPHPEYGGLSATTRMGFDCLEHEGRIIDVVGYSDHHALGAVLSTWSGAFPWTPIPAGTYVDAAFHAACGRHPTAIN